MMCSKAPEEVSKFWSYDKQQTVLLILILSLQSTVTQPEADHLGHELLIHQNIAHTNEVKCILFL